MRIGGQAIRAIYQGLVPAAILSGLLYGISTTFLATSIAQAVHQLGGPQSMAFMIAATVASILAFSVRVGPLWATRQELQWLPVDVLLRHRRRMVGASTVTLAVMVAGMFIFASSSAISDPIIVGIVIGAGVLLSGAFTYYFQCADASELVPVVSAVAALTAASIICSAAGMVALTQFWLLVLLAVALGAKRERILRSHTFSSPGRTLMPPRWALLSAGRFAEALRASMVMMDGAALQFLHDSHRDSKRPPSHFPRTAMFAIRILTSSRVVTLIPVLALPAGVHAVWGAGSATAFLVIASYVFTWRTSRSLDTYLDSPALHRNYANQGRRLPLQVIGTTVVLTVLYSIIGSVLGSLSFGVALLAISIASFGILRRLSGRRLNGRVGALMSTPMGALPIDLTRRIIAGADILIVGVWAASTSGSVYMCALIMTVAAVAYCVTFTLQGR